MTDRAILFLFCVFLIAIHVLINIIIKVAPYMVYICHHFFIEFNSITYVILLLSSG